MNDVALLIVIVIIILVFDGRRCAFIRAYVSSNVVSLFVNDFGDVDVASI